MKFSLLILGLILISCSGNREIESDKIPTSIPLVKKIAGFSLEMPSDSIPPNSMEGIIDLGGKWVALIPYSIIREGKAKVEYNHKGMWWGESLSGTADCIRMANKSGLKTMLKPHVWVIGQGWPGKFDLSTEKEWLTWEASYREYILTFAQVAEEEKVDLFCIGTEFRIAVVKRREFWRQLIKDVRGIYHGEITYASNWDNYKKVNFWSELDYIGVDAYFPFSKKKRPKLNKLVKSWEKQGEKLKAFSEKWNKKIIFTEYGFRSIEYPEAVAENGESSLKPNMKNQKTAYLAFFQTIWEEDWFIGGFLWKWKFKENPGGENDTQFTPQNKPAEKLIQKYYSKAH
ncbi:MAG: hypothetical protein HRT58_07190 [Crocinitomicaceae bacterium]|nr:hypothetical protein [Flavobacteriales bacterium]NQZ35433.1 hypothetical protein [Crocinitomicaceae bacterium]